MEATASLIGYELEFADQQYDNICHELPNAPAPAELSTAPAQISFSEPFILNESDIEWVSAEDGPFTSGIPVEVYDGETPINEASACSTARSDLQATGPSTSDGQSLRRGKKRKPQTEREEYFKKLKDSHTEINELTMEMMKEKHKKELELLDLRAEVVYNGDKTGFYWRSMPKNNRVRKGEESKRGKNSSKERLSALVCYNATAIFSDWFFHHYITDVRKFQEEELKIPADKVKAILLLDNAPAQNS
ncbi:hypothetical protein Pcinc_011392 [Petrolisthes cinctipes]|uniref:Uncharacterized protein n=1 Tax=Petrolisthes cinctipes TaxID=88211 RepID=A0AAE1G3P3_PETCI|nr:hypothetical protein Pcinc_011392 [Petrolisthes cinctipes]